MKPVQLISQYFARLSARLCCVSCPNLLERRRRVVAADELRVSLRDREHQVAEEESAAQGHRASSVFRRRLLEKKNYTALFFRIFSACIKVSYA